ncbi:MAG: type II secretion system protein [Kiritimatiellae bacterium]|nr:type II secretion system protein [Kiritimatiellia bacterium]
MKRAFTLIELLVVIGLMGLMATISIASYSAVTRGMSDRAALDAAKSIADAALQRANLDRTKTYLYLFNEVVKLESDMSAGVVCGVVVAVRPVGRITQVPESSFFCDEFGDLNQTYNSLEEEDETASESEMERQASTFRLYNVAAREYATVIEGVFKFELNDSDLEADGGAPVRWPVYGFRKTGGAATFKVGDQYGQEFAVTRLPPGYVFSSSVSMSGTADLGQKQVSVIEIKPTDSTPPSFNVFAMRPNGTFDNIGNVNQVKDGVK